MKCLDTDFLVAVLRGREDAQRKMSEIDLEGRQATTSVNAFELFFGGFKSSEKRNNVEKTTVLLERLDVLPFDSKSSESAGEALARLSPVGERIDFRDVMIAGIARVNGLALVTRNREHFSRVKDLRLESW